MPEFIKTALDGVIEVVPNRFGDDRGFFSEVYNRDLWKAGGIDAEFMQDNHSLSRQPGVLRGLHFQTPPHAQAKLVRVAQGSAYDVAVDIRTGSSTFGKWVGVELTAEKGNQLYIPEGFAHGFLTLEPDTHFLYKVSAPYAPQCDRSIRFDDPDIAIEWPVGSGDVILSDKDRKAGFLRDTETGFVYFEGLNG